MKLNTILTVFIMAAATPSFGQLFENGFLKNGVVVYIKNVETGKYLTVYNNSTTSGADIVQSTFTGNNNQKFKFILTNPGCTSAPNSNGEMLVQTDCHTYKIKSVRSGKYLKIRSSSTSNGARLFGGGVNAVISDPSCIGTSDQVGGRVG